MAKKTKSKQRLDSYYHFAKQQGYRSRAAYKLIQLNCKYNFLSNSAVLIDLCAAPGGWMQVASQLMPMNSIIVGVDLDKIKHIQGTKAIQGDITTSSCYQQLRKQIKGKKCDVILNDGSPNMGANWSKDAYTQNQLVLAALKLTCSLLKEGGYFITKVFRSNDFQSLMWLLHKFFQKVDVTKPKASRFTSAEIFVVCIGYLNPSFIDEKLFDAKYIFQDTQADHFHRQMQGQITSIDKLLQARRKRGGYEDNAPMHLYKEASLTMLIESQNPLLIFAGFNQIKVTQDQRQKYYQLVKRRPVDLDQLFYDLKVLGKREISAILKWRGKIVHLFTTQSIKKIAAAQIQEQVQQQQQDSSYQLQKQVLSHKRRQIKVLKQKGERRCQLMIKSQLANHQHNAQQQLGCEMEDVFGSDMQQLLYQQPSVEPQVKNNKNRQVMQYSAKEMEQHLEDMYQERRLKIQEKQKIIRQAKQERKELKAQRITNKQSKLKSRRFGADPELVGYYEPQYEEVVIQNMGQIKFKNPLAEMDEDDLYISDNEQQLKDGKGIDPNEQMAGEVSDDDAYVIAKPISDMQKRRKQLKRNQVKKLNKLKRNIKDGEDVGGHIEIVKERQMQDYNIDELAETLAIAKKMLHNRSRQHIIDGSYRYSFQDHDELPKWFTDDQKKHNYKKMPITKQQFQQEKARLIAINARVPKKILQAKVRRKMRIQKKLKKTQKLAEGVMNEQGLSEYNKLREVSKMYDKSKGELKDNKKYVVSQKGRTTSGKDSRNVKHVDSRMKKDKRSLKIKKKRQVHRKHKKKTHF